MMKVLFPLFSALTLFAQSSDVLVTVTPYTALFPIEPMRRSADLIRVFSVLNSSPYNANSNLEIALILNISGITGGTVQFVKGITATATQPTGQSAVLNTIAIITYSQTAGAFNASTAQYAAYPIEQISEMIYSPNLTITQKQLTSFSIGTTTGILPYYPINMVERAQDIQNVVFTLNYVKPYSKGSLQPNVSLTTSLSGTYNTLGATSTYTLVNGVIPLVKSVTAYGTMLIVAYFISSSNNTLQYIVMSPEQVISINYLLNGS